MEAHKEVYAAEQGAVKAFATDQPSAQDGTRHHYKVTHQPSAAGPEIDLCVIKFQAGIPAEVGVNGVTDEAVLSVTADHIEGFANGPCRCEANRQAAWHVREAIRLLKQRSPTQRGALGATEQ